MSYIGRSVIVLLSKDLEIKELLRRISTSEEGYFLVVVKTLEEIFTLRNPKIIFLDEKLTENCSKFLFTIKKLKNHFAIPLVIISNEKSNCSIKEFLNKGFDYVLQKPLSRKFIEVILFKHLITLRDIPNNYIRYGNISLNLKANCAYYNGCNIFLSEIESVILHTLITTNDYVDINYLKKVVKNLVGKEITINYVRTSIYRLRIKFKNVCGLDIVKNRYSKGYCISI